MNMIETIILSVTASGTTIAAVAWLTKSLISQWLGKDLENYKLQLTIAAQEHQIRFSALHQKQADVIEECYLKFVAANALIQMIQRSKSSDFNEEDRERARKAVDACFAGMMAFFRNQLYFPDHLYKRLMDFSVRVVNYAGLHNGMADMLDSMALDVKNPDRMKLIRETLFGGVKDLESEVPQLLDELKTEFRRLLGVT